MHRDNKDAEWTGGESTRAPTSRAALLNPALRLAALHGVTSSVKLHIQRGDALDGRDMTGQTALMIAASRNHLEVCTLLLQAGVDPALLDNNGLSAMELAEQAGATDTYLELANFSRNRSKLVTTESLEDCSAGTRDASPLQHPHTSHTTDPAGDDAVTGDWEALTELEPPKDDAGLRDQVARTQAAIDKHTPFDSQTTSWDEVSAYLPENFDSGRGASRSSGEASARLGLEAGKTDGGKSPANAIQTWIRGSLPPVYNSRPRGVVWSYCRCLRGAACRV